jgi:hypothetical protein
MADEEVEVIPKRFQRRQDRLDQMREMAPQRVRVNPRDDKIRSLMKHPASGGFLSEGSTEWPLDQFTKRRLREGAITIAASTAGDESVEHQMVPQPVEEPKEGLLRREPPKREIPKV